MTIPCPICRKPVEAGSEFFPFCSDRCRILDLAAWSSEDYKVPAQPDEYSDVEEE